VKILRLVSGALFLGAVGTSVLPAPVFAQHCDYQITRAYWTAHPSPDSININFVSDVVTDFPLSSDPANPTAFSYDVRFFFNGVPMSQDNQLTLKIWQSITCPTNCPGDAVCEEKTWATDKGGFVSRSSYCLRVGSTCVCPKIETPTMTHPVKKPSGPGIIETELVPLSLQSCTPIKPENDTLSFSYPNTTPPMSGFSAAGMTVLLASLGLIGLFGLRRLGPSRAA
jgi:hypothetical protein